LWETYICRMLLGHASPLHLQSLALEASWLSLCGGSSSIFLIFDVLWNESQGQELRYRNILEPAASRASSSRHIWSFNARTIGPVDWSRVLGSGGKPLFTVPIRWREAQSNITFQPLTHPSNSLRLLESLSNPQTGTANIFLHSLPISRSLPTDDVLQTTNNGVSTLCKHLLCSCEFENPDSLPLGCSNSAVVTRGTATTTIIAFVIRYEVQRPRNDRPTTTIFLHDAK